MEIRLRAATVFDCAVAAILLLLDFGQASADWTAPAISVAEFERLIEIAPDDDPKKPFLFEGLGTALLRRATLVEQWAPWKRRACLDAAATPEERRHCESEHERAIAAAKSDRHASILAWTDTLRRHPAYPRLETLLFSLASVELSVGMNSEAHTHAYELVKRFPRSPGVAQALSIMGDAQFAAGNVQAAAGNYTKIVTNYLDSPPYAHAKEMLSRCRSPSVEPILRPHDDR